MCKYRVSIALATSISLPQQRGAGQGCCCGAPLPELVPRRGLGGTQGRWKPCRACVVTVVLFQTCPGPPKKVNRSRNEAQCKYRNISVASERAPVSTPCLSFCKLAGIGLFDPRKKNQRRNSGENPACFLCSSAVRILSGAG